MLERASTGLGAAASETERSGVCTVTFAAAVLLAGVGSAVVERMLTDSVMTVPFAVAAFTWTMKEKVAVLPLFIFVVRVQVVVPVPPTATPAQFHVPVPPVCAAETNVVFGGVAMATEGGGAVLGPLLMTATA